MQVEALNINLEGSEQVNNSCIGITDYRFLSILIYNTLSYN